MHLSGTLEEQPDYTHDIVKEVGRCRILWHLAQRSTCGLSSPTPNYGYLLVFLESFLLALSNIELVIFALGQMHSMFQIKSAFFFVPKI